MKKFLDFFQFFFLLLIGTSLFGYLVSQAERGSEVRGARDLVLKIARFPGLVKEAFHEIQEHEETYLLEKNTFGYCDAVKFQESFLDSNYMLVSFYDPKIHQAKIELIRIDDGKTVFEWFPPKEEILKDFKAVRNPDVHGISYKNFEAIHSLLLEDGSVIFNLMYGPLVRIDKNSKIIWVKKEAFHHSLELDANGNIWACYNEPVSGYDSLFAFEEKVFEENSIVQLNPDGEVLFKKKVSDILIENELQGVLFGAGVFEFDPIHLNDIQPAVWDSRFWKKGDLLLSLRNRSMILLYRPSENRVIWYKVGPWVNQHDVDFVDSSYVSLFGNDMIRLKGEELTYPLRGINNVYLINLNTNEVSTPYSRIFEDLHIYTDFEGRAEILKNGQIFIEETYPGRLIIADKNQPLWSLVKCEGENNEISVLSWSRYLRKDKVNLNFLTLNHI